MRGPNPAGTWATAARAVASGIRVPVMMPVKAPAASGMPTVRCRGRQAGVVRAHGLASPRITGTSLAHVVP